MLEVKIVVSKSDIEDYEKIKKEYEEHQESANNECMHYNNNIEKDIEINSNLLFLTIFIQVKKMSK